MIHELINSKKGKTYTITLDDKTIKTQLGKRQTEKTFKSKEAALEDFYKKEWKKLKEGYILQSKNPVQGEAQYHKFIGSGYTGCLSLINLKGNIAVYQHNDFNNDLLQVHSNKGEYIETIKLPKALPWKLKYSKSMQLLIMDVDHYIYQYSFFSKKFTPLTSDFDQPGSFISLSKNKLFYGAEPNVYLKDLSLDEILFSKKIKSELYSGHSPILAGAISKNEKMLALAYKTGKIDLLNSKGEFITDIKATFGEIRDITFLNDSTIIVHERYETWGLRLFDVHSGKELENFFNDGKTSSRSQSIVQSFDINWEEKKLLTTQWKNVTVFDLVTLKPLFKFRVDHCVKSCEAIFSGKETIAVRTDYGCFSLYQI